MHEVENPVAADQSNMSTVGSDETRIIVVDTVEPQGQSELVRGIVASREHARTQASPLESHVRIPVSSTASEVLHITGICHKLLVR